jgi:hypothetical protein
VVADVGTGRIYFHMDCQCNPRAHMSGRHQTMCHRTTYVCLICKLLNLIVNNAIEYSCCRNRAKYFSAIVARLCKLCTKVTFLESTCVSTCKTDSRIFCLSGLTRSPLPPLKRLTRNHGHYSNACLAQIHLRPSLQIQQQTPPQPCPRANLLPCRACKCAFARTRILRTTADSL